MLRLFWSAFALACGIVPAFSAPPIPQDDSGSAPMRFEWRREGPAHACGAHDGKHAHGAGCGHEAIPHGNHKDYLVKGHLHHPDHGHCDDHGVVSTA